VEMPEQVSGCVESGVGLKPGYVLSLAGHRLWLTGAPFPVVQSACGWMCPPAHAVPAGEAAGWNVCVEPMERDTAPAAPSTWSCLLGDYGWPRLAMAESDSVSASAIGQYRPQDAFVQIAVDRNEHATRVRVPVDGVHSARWVDWLVRTFFGGALLTDGWQLLHAAAVSFDSRVVLLGGPPGAGKSSLAHLLCRELGAAFLGDDLVFATADAGRDVRAIGWPTRVSLPLELAGTLEGGLLDRRHVSPTWHRERRLASPAEYCATYSIARGTPGPVAAVVLLGRDDSSSGLSHLGPV
jgi:hypothetical protein